LNRPLVGFTLLWTTGYAAAYLLELSWLGLYVSLLLAIPVIIIWMMKVQGRVYICGLLLVVIAAGYYEDYDRNNNSSLINPEMIDRSSEMSVSLSGIITSRVEVDGDKASFTLLADHLNEGSQANGNESPIGEAVAVTVKLLTPSEQQKAYSWRRADQVKLNAVITMPPKARNFDGFDYRRYLRLQHIHQIASVKGISSIDVSPPESLTWRHALRWNDQFRQLLGQRIAEIFPKEQDGFMKSMLIGLTDDMDPLQFQQFSQLGLTHILAVSGLNVAVFLACLLWLLRKLRLTREACLLTAIALLPVYIALTGGSPSIVRAGLMAMIGLYTAYRHTWKDGLHSVLFVGLLMLVWEPYYLLDVSFQLSFLVTIGLILGVPPVNRLLPIRSQVLKNTCSITLVAQIISFPVSIYYFNQFSLLSFAANLCLVPVFSLVTMPVGTAALVVGMIYIPAGQVLGWLAAKINDWVFIIVSITSRWDMFQTIWPSPGINWMIGYYTAITVIIWGLLCLQSLKNPQEGPMLSIISSSSRFSQFQSIRKAIIHMPLPFAIISLLVLLTYGYNPDKWTDARNGQVHFIDVGQGDSIFIRSPQSRSVILIDGGGTVTFRKPGDEWKQRKDPYEVGRKLLVPLLKKRGIQQIDYLIISHEDADHIGGLQAVLEQIPVKQLVFNGTFKPGGAVEKLFQTALDKQIKMVKVNVGDTLKVDAETELQVLFPMPPAKPSEIRIEKAQNGESVVLQMNMQRTQWLFTGDMEQASEASVLSMLGKKTGGGGGRCVPYRCVKSSASRQQDLYNCRMAAGMEAADGSHFSW
jgi:competence protein ComEC